MTSPARALSRPGILPSTFHVCDVSAGFRSAVIETLEPSANAWSAWYAAFESITLDGAAAAGTPDKRGLTAGMRDPSASHLARTVAVSATRIAAAPRVAGPELGGVGSGISTTEP